MKSTGHEPSARGGLAEGSCWNVRDCDEHPDEALTLLREIRDSLSKLATRPEVP